MSNSSRGFASMSPEKQREIASKGGKAAHRKGTAHQFTSEEAKVAGRKGGQASGLSRARKNEHEGFGGTLTEHREPVASGHLDDVRHASDEIREEQRAALNATGHVSQPSEESANSPRDGESWRSFPGDFAQPAYSDTRSHI